MVDPCAKYPRPRSRDEALLASLSSSRASFFLELLWVWDFGERMSRDEAYTSGVLLVALGVVFVWLGEKLFRRPVETAEDVVRFMRRGRPPLPPAIRPKPRGHVAGDPAGGRVSPPLRIGMVPWSLLVVAFAHMNKGCGAQNSGVSLPEGNVTNRVRSA